MPYLLFLKKQQNLKASSAANYRLINAVNAYERTLLQKQPFQKHRISRNRLINLSIDIQFLKLPYKLLNVNLSELIPLHLIMIYDLETASNGSAIMMKFYERIAEVC